MFIKPVQTIAYLCYECSNCGMSYEELRLSEAHYPRTFCCEHCNNVDQIYPVGGIALEYARVTALVESEVAPVNKIKSAESVHTTNLLSLLNKLGYEKPFAKTIVTTVIRENPRLSYSSLVKVVLDRAVTDSTPNIGES